MILQVLPNGKPHTQFGMADKLEVTSVFRPTIKQVTDQCNCCCPIYNVFSGSNERESDKSSFIYRKTIRTDTIDIFLYKDGVQIAALNDNTYGTYFATFPTIGSQAGYQLEWELVFGLHGAGKYQIIAEVTIVSVPNTIESIEYTLLPYSDELADLTVRIETIMDVKVRRSEIDYRSLNWYQQIRIPATFIQVTPELTLDFYPDTDYASEGIQHETQLKYELRSRFITGDVRDFIFNNNLMTDKIFITDYNKCNSEKYTKLPLYPVSIDELKKGEQTSNETIAITFTDKKQDNFSRKF